MKSVKKIGNTVLEKFFPSKDLKKLSRKTYAMGRTWPTDWLPDKDGKFSMGDWQFDYGYNFSVWGIELGLIHLEVKENTTIENLIVVNEEIKRRKFLPTHLAKIHWNLENGIRKEEVTIYFLERTDIDRIKQKILN